MKRHAHPIRKPTPEQTLNRWRKGVVNTEVKSMFDLEKLILSGESAMEQHKQITLKEIRLSPRTASKILSKAINRKVVVVSRSDHPTGLIFGKAAMVSAKIASTAEISGILTPLTPKGAIKSQAWNWLNIIDRKINQGPATSAWSVFIAALVHVATVLLDLIIR